MILLWNNRTGDPVKLFENKAALKARFNNQEDSMKFFSVLLFNDNGKFTDWVSVESYLYN